MLTYEPVTRYTRPRPPKTRFKLLIALALGTLGAYALADYPLQRRIAHETAAYNGLVRSTTRVPTPMMATPLFVRSRLPQPWPAPNVRPIPRSADEFAGLYRPLPLADGQQKELTRVRIVREPRLRRRMRHELGQPQAIDRKAGICIDPVATNGADRLVAIEDQ